MNRLELLDYGRFFAAIAVMIFHYTFNGILNGKINSISHIPGLVDVTKYGYLGVEFFFMISGYVIFFSAQNKTASQFIISRFIRLFPAFWVAVFFTAFFALFWGGPLMAVSAQQVIVNLTMVPELFGKKPVDGVYWTLAYELSFYIAVFFIMLVGDRKALNTIFLAWPSLMAAALAIGGGHLLYMGEHYAFFAAGAIFALLKQKPEWKGFASLGVAFILCIAYASEHTDFLEMKKGVEYSPLVISVVVTLFFAFFLFANTKAGSEMRLPKSYLLGALTYPIYLIHAYFGYMVLSQFANEENKILVYAITILIVFAVSYLIHRVIEVRLSSLWKKVFDQSVGRCARRLEFCLSRSSADQ